MTPSKGILLGTFLRHPVSFHLLQWDGPACASGIPKVQYSRLTPKEATEFQVVLRSPLRNMDHNEKLFFSSVLLPSVPFPFLFFSFPSFLLPSFLPYILLFLPFLPSFLNFSFSDFLFLLHLFILH